jgi:hypothetical protein
MELAINIDHIIKRFLRSDTELLRWHKADIPDVPIDVRFEG